jgi:hypothetical protein
MTISLSRSWSIRPRLSIRTMVLLIAALSLCFALAAAACGLAPELRAVVARPALVAVVAWWSLASAAAALWVSEVRRPAPASLLLRFVVGNSFLAFFIGTESPLLVVMLLGIAALLPSRGGSAGSLRAPGPGRVPAAPAMAGSSSYIIQLALTLALFLASLVPLGYYAGK